MMVKVSLERPAEGRMLISQRGKRIISSAEIISTTTFYPLFVEFKRLFFLLEKTLWLLSFDSIDKNVM